MKQLLPRAFVLFTPKWGYTMTLPQVTSTSAKEGKGHIQRANCLEASGKRPRTNIHRFVEVELLDFFVDFYILDAFNFLPEEEEEHRSFSRSA